MSWPSSADGDGSVVTEFEDLRMVTVYKAWNNEIHQPTALREMLDLVFLATVGTQWGHSGDTVGTATINAIVTH